MNILLIEDDASTAQHVAGGLHALGHVIEIAPDGRTGLAMGSDARFDVLVVDRMLPGFDGLTVVRTLRTGGVATPIIFLTAVSGVADRIQGLRAGADDYLIKPFEVEELEARIEALGRRRPMATSATVLQAGALSLDRLSRKVSLAGAPIDLTASEFKMLETLLLNLGHTMTKAMLLETVFGLESAAPATIIEPHMSRLRAKLHRPGSPDFIRTVRGAGYIIVSD